MDLLDRANTKTAPSCSTTTGQSPIKPCRARQPALFDWLKTGWIGMPVTRNRLAWHTQMRQILGPFAGRGKEPFAGRVDPQAVRIEIGGDRELRRVERPLHRRLAMISAGKKYV